MPDTPENLHQGVLELLLERDERPFNAMLGSVRADQFESALAGVKTILAPGEEETLARYPLARRRQSYLLGRYCAKRALSPLLAERDFTAIEIASGVFEQPLVIYPTRRRFEVSLTHSEQGAFAIAFPEGHPMGIDVETPDAERAATMTAQLTPRELEWAKPDLVLRSTLAWTAREALSKVLKCGLMVPLELLALDPESLRFHQGAWEGRFEHFAQYRLITYVAPGTILSLVLPRRTRLLTGANEVSAVLPQTPIPFS